MGILAKRDAILKVLTQIVVVSVEIKSSKIKHVILLRKHQILQITLTPNPIVGFIL